MSVVPSHYATLGMTRQDFSPEQLKKNYRALALRWCVPFIFIFLPCLAFGAVASGSLTPSVHPSQAP